MSAYSTITCDQRKELTSRHCNCRTTKCGPDTSMTGCYWGDTPVIKSPYSFPGTNKDIIHRKFKKKPLFMEYEIRDFMCKIILDPVVQSLINSGLVEILI